MANGAILWEGKSAIDGKPVMLIATGIKGKASRNSKTGNLVQTWVLRADISPTLATHTGEDSSVCGDCPHRGEIVNGKNVKRSCYVTVFQAPLNIWKTAKRGRYPRVKGDKAAALLAGLNVRLGAYGDPAAIPFHAWARILKHTARGTGYTHQWRQADSRFSRYCMASADNAQEAETARAMGYRTFRVGTLAESLVKGQEFLCPASEQAGKRTNCAACLACGGTQSPNRASVYIPAHGAANKVRAFETRATS
jgi:hypothetical protein